MAGLSPHAVGARRLPPRRLRRSVRVASLRRRLLAGVVDSACLLVSGLAVGALATKVDALRRLRVSRLAAAWGGGGRRGVEARLVMLALAPVGRNVRGPGARVAGIRRVDARTGGPVSIRSAIVAHVISQMWGALTNHLLAPVRNARIAKLKTLQSQFDRLQRERRGDAEALSTLYREHGVNPFASCTWIVPQIALACAIQLPTPWSPVRRGLVERLAGTVVVMQR
jgi:hypothetical protein